MNQASVNVWVGNYGTYKVPDDIVDSAKALNGIMKITDRRTRGFKILKAWGESADKGATH